jgi:hypothetical protein
MGASTRGGDVVHARVEVDAGGAALSRMVYWVVEERPPRDHNRASAEGSTMPASNELRRRRAHFQALL